MIIAIDFDNTFTLDVDLWKAFINHARDRGHEVICVTMNFEGDEYVLNHIGYLVDEVIFTEGEDKKPVAQRHGWDVDVWIDDTPEWI